MRRTKITPKSVGITIRITVEKRDLFNSILRENNEAKTDIIMGCINKYILKNKKE